MQVLPNVKGYYCRLLELPIMVNDFHSHSEFFAFPTWAINFDPVPLTSNLPTIGHKAFASLSNDPMEVFDPMPSTPPVPTTPQTPTLQSSSSEDHKVSEDVIQSLVIPSKSKGVGDVL